VLEELIESRKSALKVEEVAQILSVSQRLVYQLVAVGEIPHFKVGSAVRFEPKALSDWLHEKLQASGKTRSYQKRMAQGQTGTTIPFGFDDIWRAVLLPKRKRV
jgi:excisionase family DNA binding protein